MLKKIMLGLVLTCGANVALAEGPKMGGVINAVIQPEPPGLMLALIQNGPTQMVSGNIYEGLLAPSWSRCPASPRAGASAKTPRSTPSSSSQA